MSDAVLAIAGERSVDAVLQRIVHVARELVDARYAALGVPDGQGAFARFITSGMSDELVAAMGPLPRTHGLLGATLETTEPYRTADIKRDPRFRGWWPSRASRDALVPRRADRRPRRGGRRLLPDRQGGRRAVQRGGPGADRAARAARRGGDGERVAARAQPRAEHRGGAQPARARAARLGGAEAVRGGAGGRVRGHAAGARPRRRPRPRSSASASWPRTRSPSCARSCSSCARWRSRARAWPRRCASTWRCCGGSTASTSGSSCRARRGCGRAWTRRSFASPRRRCTTRCATRAADAITVRLDERDDGLTLAVSDDGSGFDPAAAELRSQSLGLTTMEERARELGGRAARWSPRPERARACGWSCEP